MDLFRALAHPVRRKIVAATVGRSQSFTALRELSRRSPATLAGHLRILREARLLAATRRGQVMEYRVNRRMLRSGAHWLTAMAGDGNPASDAA